MESTHCLCQQPNRLGARPSFLEQSLPLFRPFFCAFHCYKFTLDVTRLSTQMTNLNYDIPIPFPSNVDIITSILSIAFSPNGTSRTHQSNSEWLLLLAHVARQNSLITPRPRTHACTHAIEHDRGNTSASSLGISHGNHSFDHLPAPWVPRAFVCCRYKPEAAVSSRESAAAWSQ